MKLLKITSKNRTALEIALMFRIEKIEKLLTIFDGISLQIQYEKDLEELNLLLEEVRK